MGRNLQSVEKEINIGETMLSSTGFGSAVFQKYKPPPKIPGAVYFKKQNYFNELIQPAIFKASPFGTCGIGGISVA